MLDLNTCQQKGGVSNQASVAPPPQTFRAHDRRLRRCYGIDQRGKSGLEFGRLHVIRIAAKGGVTQRDVGRIGLRLSKSAQFWIPFVTSAAKFGNPPSHLDFPNVGMAPTARYGSHIDDELDSGRPDQRGKLRGARRAVSERKQIHAGSVPGIDTLDVPRYNPLVPFAGA